MSATEVHVVKTAHSSCELLCNRGKSHSGKVFINMGNVLITAQREKQASKKAML